MASRPRPSSVPAMVITGLDPLTIEFYCHAMTAMTEAGVPFLVGGAYALERYTGIARHTKDFDVFVRPADVDRTLEALASVGCQTDLTFEHWLGKAFRGEDFVDVIFSSGNAIATVDDRWFERAVDAQVLGMPAKLCPPEEMIWSKSFIMERERYDGADVAHLIHGVELDWAHLLERFGEQNWPVLLSHIVLFRYIYPAERDRVPASVIRELTGRLHAELDQSPDRAGGAAPSGIRGVARDGARGGGRLCRGTILSRGQYLVDIDHWGYRDARLQPHGNMTRRQIARWTAAIDEEK